MTAAPFNLDAFRLHFCSVKTRELHGHRAKVNSVAWSCDGERLASGASDHTIRIWHLERIAASIADSNGGGQGRVLNPLSPAQAGGMELTGHERGVDQVVWCPFAPSILASASADKTVRIWDVSRPPPPTPVTRATKRQPLPDTRPQPAPSIVPTAVISTNGENINLCWHPHERRLAVGTKDDTILIYQLNETWTEAVLQQTIKGDVEVNELAWSPTGDQFAVCMGSGVVQLYRLDPHTQLLTLERSLRGHTANCYCARFSADGLLAVGGADAQVTLWTRDQDYTCLRVFPRMQWPIRTLAFSHDGLFLAFGSEDAFIAIEHVHSGSLVAKLPTTVGRSDSKTVVPINAVAWHPNKHLLVYAGEEMDDRTGKPTGTIRIFGLC